MANGGILPAVYDDTVEFLTNHAKVLLWVALHPDATIAEIAGEVSISRRAVQMSLRALREEGHIERRRVGRRNTYRVVSDHKLVPDHPKAHLTVRDLIALIDQDHPWWPDPIRGGSRPVQPPVHTAG